VVDLARNHTTVSVERATLRLAGLSGAEEFSWPANFQISFGYAKPVAGFGHDLQPADTFGAAAG